MIRNLQSELRPHLDQDENLLWTGQPKTGIIFRTADIFMIPFSILWCGFAIFWVILASQGSVLFALFGVPFVIVGLIAVFGRFIIDAKQRQHTIYGITENRILIKSGVFSKNIRSLNLKTISDISLNEKGDGIGTISIGPTHPFMDWGQGMNWWFETAMNPRLELIPNARQVYNQILELQQRK